MTSFPSSNTDSLAFAVPPAASPVTDLFQGLLKSSSAESTSQKSAPTIDEDVLAGLSPEDRAAFLQSQNPQSTKPAPTPSPAATSNRSAAALAFDQRSSAAVAKIAASFETGTAVDGVVADNDADFRAAQIDEDAKLAAKLQEEEYAAERRRTERRRARAAASSGGESWMDWMMGSSSTTAASGGAPAGASNRSTAAAPAQGGARVAQSKGMFACVGDAIATAINPPQQVRGVDSTSLLSMT